MLITDALALDAASVRLTRDGYMVAVARIARTGVQSYSAGELGLADRAADEIVRVYRPAEEVFAPEAMASLAHRPMTMDHPSEAVTADNWKRHAIGTTGGEVTRDGDTVSVPLTLMDASAIAEVQAGKRQLSVGYSCELVFEDGVTPEGETYDAVQRGIRGNHVAVCGLARGGPRLRIGDAEELIVDGVALGGLSAAARAAVEGLQGRVVALDAEVAALTQRLAAAVPTPAELQALAAARVKLIADAARVAGSAVASDGSDAEVRRAAVSARLGAGVAAMSDAAVEGAFAALLSAPVGDAAREVILSGTRVGDEARTAFDAARAGRFAHFETAYRGVADAA